MNIRRILFAATLLLAGSLLAQRPQIETGTNVGKLGVRLALPEFPVRQTSARSAQLTTLFNQTLWDDLDYSGGITLVSRSFYPKKTIANPVDLVPEEWTRPGIEAEFAAFGNIDNSAAGRFVIEARLWDLKGTPENREALGRRYIGEDTEESVRLMAHRLADDIVQIIGGARGISQTKIAFVSSRDNGRTKEIWIMDYDGSGAFQLTNTRSTALTPSWAPDGEKVAYTNFQRSVPGISIVSRIDRRAFRFESFPATTTTPSWSPDGSRVAFSSSMERQNGQNDMEVFASDWNGRNPRRLTFSRGVDISPAWNPRTGKEIAFVSDRTGSPQIYMMDDEGGNVRRIVQEGGHAVSPAWSPDGQRLAFAWQKGGSNFDIYIYEVASGRIVQLTSNAGSNERPTWAPDGRHIAFESTRLGRRTSQIFSMLADGTKVRQLTTSGRNQGPAWSGFITP